MTGLKFKINTTGATSGVGTVNPSGAPAFTPAFSGVRVTRSLVLCVCFVDRYGGDGKTFEVMTST
jgi:hypothetical protein